VTVDVIIQSLMLEILNLYTGISTTVFWSF